MADGYTPSQYVRQDRLGIGAASQILGTTIANIPKIQMEKEEFQMKKDERQAAIDAAKANWKDMDIAYTTIRKRYIQSAQPLIKQGVMSKEELQMDLQKLQIPTSVDKKDPGAYMDKLGENYGNLLNRLQEKSQTQNLGIAIQEGMTPKPTQFTPEFEQSLITPPGEAVPTTAPAIKEPAREAPGTTQELMGRIPPEMAASKEGIAAVKGTGLPTPQQAQKSEREQKRFEFEQAKFKYKKEEDKRSRGDKGANTAAAQQKLALAKKKLEIDIRGEIVDMSTKLAKAKKEFNELTTDGYVVRKAIGNMPERREPATDAMIKSGSQHIATLEAAKIANEKELKEMDQPEKEGGKTAGDYKILEPEAMQADEDTLARAAKLRSMGVNEDVIKAFMTRRMQEQQAQ